MNDVSFFVGVVVVSVYVAAKGFKCLVVPAQTANYPSRVSDDNNTYTLTCSVAKVSPPPQDDALLCIIVISCTASSLLPRWAGSMEISNLVSRPIYIRTNSLCQLKFWKVASLNVITKPGYKHYHSVYRAIV